jgi:hypothetical protein
MTISSDGRVHSWAAPWVVGVLLIAAPLGSGTSAAQRSRPAAPPAAAPAPAQPQVSAVGIRVVGAGLGANGSELRAFNESPGTVVALAIQASAGAGIVDIDSHASKLDAFSDDKGQSLLEEGRVGSFPKIAEDGSAALVEIEVRARPSAGAVSVRAQGSLTMTVANGSKPQRIANVRLEENRTMRVGAATITITNAKVDDDSTNLTFGLTRSVLNTIRAVRFFDAKGAAIESRRTGSGYMNEKAELEYKATTKDPTVAVEFDVWQNPHAVKVPFNVQAGLGMAAGGRASAAVASSSSREDSGRGISPSVSRPPAVIAPGDGAASVEAVVKQLQTSAATGKAGPLLAVIYPDDRPVFAQAVAMVVTFSTLAHMDDPKVAEKAQKEVDALFTRQKVKPPFNRDPAVIFKDVDLTAFVADALTLLRSQLKKGDNPADMLPVPAGKPQDVKMTGDSAVATLGGKDVKFTKASGRWFIRLEPESR